MANIPPSRAAFLTRTAADAARSRFEAKSDPAGGRLVDPARAHEAASYPALKLFSNDRNVQRDFQSLMDGRSSRTQRS